MADSWFRWYSGTIDDGKMRAVARYARVTLRDVIATWALLLEEASSIDHRGICTKNEDYIAAVLEFDEGVTEAILSSMESQGMISVGHGDISVTHWGKRQFESDARDPTAAERMRRHRGKTRPVTPPLRPVTDGYEQLRPDTDTDTDKKASSLRSDTGGADEKKNDDAAISEFEVWWGQFPRYRRGAKGPAQKIFVSLVKRSKATAADLIAGLGRYNDAGYSDSEYACGAETWLNKQRWTIERFAPPGDKHTPAPAAAAPNLRYSNSSLARSLLQEIEHDHDRASPSRNGVAVHGAEDAGKRGAGPVLSPSYLRLAGPDETER